MQVRFSNDLIYKPVMGQQSTGCLTFRDIYKKVFFNKFEVFVSYQLEDFKGLNLRFDIKTFFLQSLINDKIKTAPAFVFSLESRENRGVFISCFYFEKESTVFESLSKIGQNLSNPGFFLNWFEHKYLEPQYPLYRDKISNVFYSENKFLNYRIFDVSDCESEDLNKLLYARYFVPGQGVRTRFLRRSKRFYKRKYTYFSRI